MARLLDLKERKDSIGKIKKITRALEVVALTRLRKLQKDVLSSRSYSEKIKKLVFEVSGSINYKEHPLLQIRKEIKSVGIILVTGDKGLCGGFNRGIIDKAEQLYREKTNFDIKFIAIGKKGHNFLISENRQIFDYVFDLSRAKEVLKLDIYQLADRLIENFLAKEIDELFIVYSNFKMQILGEVKVEKMLPLDIGNSILKASKRSSNSIRDYIYEPNQYDVFERLLMEYMRNFIFHATIESRTAEEMARMMAMKQARDNAEELIRNLMLVYHKERQSSITRELIDIINASGLQSY